MSTIAAVSFQVKKLVQVGLLLSLWFDQTDSRKAGDSFASLLELYMMSTTWQVVDDLTIVGVTSKGSPAYAKSDDVAYHNLNPTEGVFFIQEGKDVEQMLGK